MENSEDIQIGINCCKEWLDSLGVMYSKIAAENPELASQFYDRELAKHLLSINEKIFLSSNFTQNINSSPSYDLFNLFSKLRCHWEILSLGYKEQFSERGGFIHKNENDGRLLISLHHCQECFEKIISPDLAKLYPTEIERLIHKKEVAIQKLLENDKSNSFQELIKTYSPFQKQERKPKTKNLNRERIKKIKQIQNFMKNEFSSKDIINNFIARIIKNQSQFDNKLAQIFWEANFSHLETITSKEFGNLFFYEYPSLKTKLHSKFNKEDPISCKTINYIFNKHISQNQQSKSSIINENLKKSENTEFEITSPKIDPNRVEEIYQYKNHQHYYEESKKIKDSKSLTIEIINNNKTEKKNFQINKKKDLKIVLGSNSELESSKSYIYVNDNSISPEQVCIYTSNSKLFLECVTKSHLTLLKVPHEKIIKINKDDVFVLGNVETMEILECIDGKLMNSENNERFYNPRPAFDNVKDEEPKLTLNFFRNAQNTKIEVSKNECFKIGRNPDMNYVYDFEGISRFHCKINHYHEFGWCLEEFQNSKPYTHLILKNFLQDAKQDPSYPMEIYPCKDNPLEFVCGETKFRINYG